MNKHISNRTIPQLAIQRGRWFGSPLGRSAVTRWLMLWVGLAGLSLLATSGTGWAATGVRAYLDHNPVYVGETVTLTIELNGRSGAASPDLTPLDADFRVLGTSQGSEVSIINGQRSDTQRWQITLQPKGAGSYPVPPISLGSQQTEALTLEVKEVPPEVARRQAETLFVEAEIGAVDGGIHVQQQIPMTVRLYSSVSISDGTLGDPAPADTVVERLGQDRRYSSERNGRRYQVIERHYALFPERSGELIIPPVSFRGSVPASQQAGGGSGRRGRSSTAAFSGFNDPFFDRVFRDSGFGGLFGSNPMGRFGPRQAISAQSQSITVQVQARPAEATAANWLPAQQLELTDSWQQQVPEWQVGKPVERTITLRATGLAGSQIPQMSLPPPDGVRSYPAKPRHESRTDGERVFGISEQTFTYIPTRQGSLELPEVSVQWWDTSSQQQRTATLPRWQVQVAAGVMPAETAPGQAGIDASSASDTAATSTAFGSGSLQAMAADLDTASGRALHRYRQLQTQYPWLPWVLAGLLLWPLLAAGRRFGRRRSAAAAKAGKAGVAHPANISTKPARQAVAETREAFNRACATATAVNVAQALMEWARAEWPDRPPAGLAALAARLQQGGDEVLALEHALYAPDAGNWDASGLQRALSRGLLEKMAGSPTSASDLAPLYPQR